MSPDEALARIRRYDGRLKALVRVFEPALGEARRRLGERGRCGTPEPNYFVG